MFDALAYCVQLIRPGFTMAWDPAGKGKQSGTAAAAVAATASAPAPVPVPIAAAGSIADYTVDQMNLTWLETASEAKVRQLRHDSLLTHPSHHLDIILDRFSRIFQLHPTPHVPCAVIYLAPMLIGCWLVLGIRYYDQFGGPFQGKSVSHHTSQIPASSTSPRCRKPGGSGSR